jgi:sugar/nucleoside kinase (ribokinase family)
MCLAPAAVQAAAVEIASIRAEADPSDGFLASWQPAVVWEPHPQACKPEQLEAFKASLAHVDVCSPNHEEAAGSSFHPSARALLASLISPCCRLAALFSLPTPRFTDEYEQLAHQILSCPLLPTSSSIVLRCGVLGSLVGVHPSRAEADYLRWVPAFWNADEQDEVRDVTGAGNSFLGGLIAGLSLNKGDIYEGLWFATVERSAEIRATDVPATRTEAALYASVSASFVCQQFGLPLITRTEGRVLWNGEDPHERLRALRERLDR